jgi:hypothetical protein
MTGGIELFGNEELKRDKKFQRDFDRALEIEAWKHITPEDMIQAYMSQGMSCEEATAKFEMEKI